MSITIYGNTVGTPTSPKKIEEVLSPVKTVNGQAPDEKGNVEIKGGSGIYIGSGEMPEGYNVQIDPEGEVVDLASLMTEGDVEQAIEDALEDFEPPASGGGIEVSGAEVGQILKVKEVDENGVPTAWEMAELPTGDEWELIVNYTVPENCVSASITTDLNGNPFDLKEAFIVCSHKPALQEDGSYIVSANSIAVMDTVAVNAASAKVGVTTPVSGVSNALHNFSIISSSSYTPDKSASGRVLFIVYLKRISEDALYVQGNASKNSLIHSASAIGCNHVSVYAFPEINSHNVVAAVHPEVQAELCSIKALHMGHRVDESLGAGSVLRMWGVRR